MTKKLAHDKVADVTMRRDPDARAAGHGGFSALEDLVIPWYERGMKAAAKIAISLPAETLAQVEALRERTGKSRSAIFAEAIEGLLAREQVDERDQRYVEAYLRKPVHQEEIAALASVAAATWEPWA